MEIKLELFVFVSLLLLTVAILVTHTITQLETAFIPMPGNSGLLGKAGLQNIAYSKFFLKSIR